MRKLSTVVILICALASMCLNASVCMAEIIRKSRIPLPGAEAVKSLDLARQAVEIQPSEPMVEPGSTSRPVTIIARLPVGSKGTVTISISGLPADITTRPAFPVTLTKNGTEGPEMKYSFRLVANSRVLPNGLTPVTLTAVVKPTTPINGSLNTVTLSKTIKVNVHPKSSEFTVYATPGTLDISRGKSANFDVIIDRWGSEKRDVTINLATPPMSGVSITPYPSSNTFPPSLDKKTYTINVSPTANLGSETLTFGATGIVLAPSGTKSEPFYLTYRTIQPDFSIAVSPQAVTVMQAATSSPVNVTVTKINGCDSPVTIGTNVLPSGVTSAALTDATTGNATVTFTASDTATPGTYPITLIGTGVINGQTIQHSQTVNLTIEELPGDFTMELSTPSVSVDKGKDSAPVTVLIARNGSFKDAVDIDLTGLPSGVTSKQTLPIRITESQKTCTFTLSVGASAATAISTITVKGTGYPKTSKTASATLRLTVNNAAGDFILGITTVPNPMNIEFKKTGTLYVKATRSGSFTGNVNVTLVGLPTGVTTPNVNALIPTGSDTATYVLTATEASKFETDNTLTATGTGSVNGKTTTRSATTKVSVLRVMGDFKAVNPNSKSNITGSDGKLKAVITGTNPYDVIFQKAPASGSSSWTQVAGPIPFAIGPSSNLGGVCFNEASTCGIVLTGKGSGGYGFASDYQYTIVWLYGAPALQQQYQVNVSKGFNNFWPELRFSPDGSLALLSAADKFGTANYQVHLVDIVGGRILQTLYATVLTGGMPVYPSAKVYLSGGKTKVDVTSDGTTRTFDVP